MFAVTSISKICCKMKEHESETTNMKVTDSICICRSGFQDYQGVHRNTIESVCFRPRGKVK